MRFQIPQVARCSGIEILRQPVIKQCAKAKEVLVLEEPMLLLFE